MTNKIYSSEPIIDPIARKYGRIIKKYLTIKEIEFHCFEHGISLKLCEKLLVGTRAITDNNKPLFDTLINEAMYKSRATVVIANKHANLLLKFDNEFEDHESK